jgi:urease accessory protein
VEPLRLIHCLQVTDSFFPIGAFAYSDGLETAVAAGLVRDSLSLGEWMDHFLEGVLIPCEGLALVKCMLALKADDLDTVRRLDEEITAIRPASAARAASAGVGKRLLSLYAAICGDTEFARSASRMLPCGNAAPAYATVFFHCGLGERDALLAFGYNRLASIVSAGLRLISLGQQQGQALLTKTLDRLPGASDRILEMVEEPLRSFSPLVDIQQMNHQYVYSRLFRS